MHIFKEKQFWILLISGWLTASCSAGAQTFHDWAPTPTMGWNSWDYYGTVVTEDQIKAQADYMASNLLTHGWDLITVDIQWYAPDPAAAALAGGEDSYHVYFTANDELAMDGYGRLIPAPSRFPSAADGMGFTALADYVHSKGLRFGIHMMRGIPKQAVIDDLPILGTPYTARDIADTGSTCPWQWAIADNYGVDLSKPGAQEYYNSLYDMYAAWGVDFVKIDDISRYDDPGRKAEIEAIRAAIDQCGREIVFSTSPGETPLRKGEHILTHANQWRISDDFWDNWGPLYDQFQRLHDWTPYRGPGHFPDADMLPLGKVSAKPSDPDGRLSNFNTNTNEAYTMMSLWSIARSPLIHGGDMTQMDAFTLSLLTNDEVIAVNQQSTHNRQLFRTGDRIAWVADAVGSSNKYLAVFNTSGGSLSVPVDLTDLGYQGPCTIRRLWDQSDQGTFSGTFSPNINAHGAQLYCLSGMIIPTPWVMDISPDDSQITLAWEDLASATSYIVKRSLSETGPFMTVDDYVTATSFTDITVTNGTAYYYAVSARVGGQESPNSNVCYGVPVSATGIVSWNLDDYSTVGSPDGGYSSNVAGVVPAANWQNTWHTDPTTDLKDNHGNVTSVDIAYSSYNTWKISGTDVHPGQDEDGSYNKEMLHGYLNAGPASWNPSPAHSAVTLSEIPYDQYDIYVYFCSDVADREGTVTDGAVTHYFKTIGPASIAGGNAVFVQATNTTENGYLEAANYAVFSGQSGVDQTVTVQMRDHDEWGGIAGVQVVSRRVPEFSAVAVSGGVVMLHWSSDTQGTYRIERKNDLASTNGWTLVTNGLSGGVSNIISVSLSGSQSEFFRVSGE